MVLFFPPTRMGVTRGPADLYPDELSRGHVGLIWGEQGVGKTSLALQAALNEAIHPNRTVLFLNTHQYPIFQRVSQFSPNFPGVNADRIKVMQIQSFQQLWKSAWELENLANLAKSAGQPLSLFVLDSITNLYTLALGTKTVNIRRNQELNEIFGLLKYAGKKYQISILVTAEEKFLDIENIIERKPAGGRIMNYWVDFSLKIERDRELNVRTFNIKKHPAGIQSTWSAKMQEAGLTFIESR